MNDPDSSANGIDARHTGGGANGRFAPSPSGPLHVGNLRTALLAWLFARSAGGRFLVRCEDLDRDRVRPGAAAGQLADLAALGLDWDEPPLHQSTRLAHYEAAIARLRARGRLYECFCTRAEIRQAASAPHGTLPEGAYPGSCRELSASQRARRRAGGRPPGLRLDARGEPIDFDDRLRGPQRAVVDDMVVRRNDGVPAYNLAVVVDDAAQGVAEVVRGADLLATTPRQILLARELGLPVPSFAHVPLVLGFDGARLAKRHGAITLGDWHAGGGSTGELVAQLARSAGLDPGGPRPTPRELLARFDPSALSPAPARWRGRRVPALAQPR